MAYGKVEETFWSDELIRRLSEDARSFMLYLLTCPHRNRLGCFVLDAYYAGGDLLWENPRVIAARTEIERAGRIRWDPGTRVIYITNHWRHNLLRNQQAVKGAVSELQSIPDNPFLPQLLADIEANERNHYQALIEAVRARVEKSTPPPGIDAPVNAPINDPVNENPAEPREDPVNNPINDPVNGSSTCSDSCSEAEAKLKLKEQPGESDCPVDDGDEPEPDPPGSGGGSSSEEARPGTRVGTLPRGALKALGAMTHPGGKRGTIATLEARFLYDDDAEDLAYPEVQGLPLEERLRLVASALVDFRDQVGTWNPAAFAKFVKRARGEPKPGTEAATARKRGEPNDAARRSTIARYQPEEYSGPRPAKGALLKMVEELGVKPPPPPEDETEEDQDESGDPGAAA